MGTRIQHLTLEADTVATVTLDRNYARVEVLNVDGAAAVYFTVDGADPEVEGDDSQVIPAAIGAIRVESGADTISGRAISTVVKLISSGTPKVSVAGG